MQNTDACKQVFWTAVSTGHTPENAVLESDRACILEFLVDPNPSVGFPSRVHTYAAHSSSASGVLQQES